MIHILISCYLICISSFLSAAYIFLSKPKTQLKITWSLFAFFVCIWNIPFTYGLLTKDYFLGLELLRMANSFALFVPIFFFHFIVLLTNNSLKLRKLLILLYVASFLLLFFIILFPSLFIPSAISKVGLYQYPDPGILYSIFTFIFISTVILSEILLLRYLAKCPENEKNKIQIVFIGVFIGFSGVFTTFLPIYQIHIFPWGLYLIPFYVWVVSYAIYKHNLMDIKIVIRRSLAYTLLITFITIIYFSLIISLEYLFKQYFGYHSLILTILFASVITVAFIPLRNISQKFVDNLFFKGSYAEIAEYYDQYKNEAAEKEKFKTAATLASGIAHEIKNPLTSLQTFFEYYPKKKDDPEFMKTFTRIAPREFERINALIHELLDFAKPSPPQLQKTDIHTLLKESLDLLSSKIKGNTIALEESFQANPSTLTADPHQIKQAFINILLNAIEAMPKGGRLVIRTYNKNKQLCIEIMDTGCGIPLEKIDHIFEPFYTTKDTGTGLGLAITKSLMEKNKGQLTIESKENTYTKAIILFKC